MVAHLANGKLTKRRYLDDMPHTKIVSRLRIATGVLALTTAFFVPSSNLWAQADQTDMHPGVAERKWEVDSLCYCIRLAHGYWRATGDASPFGAEWAQAMKLVIATFREQQRKHGQGSYHFQRRTEVPTDTQALDGYGLIYSMFRPSDDACIYPLFVPANLFAMTSLRWLADMADAILHDAAFASECRIFATEIESALAKYGRVQDSTHGEVWAYEVDGYGNQLFMDDANLPGLLGLPYLGCCKLDDPLYRRTRARALSESNPYFFKGKAAEVLEVRTWGWI